MASSRTPLRYPGGKQKLSPFVKEVLLCNGISTNYVEPYAGGGGIALNLLIDGDIEMVHLNDSSLPIYAFWSSVLNDNNKFCHYLSTIPINVEEWRRQKEIMRDYKSKSLFDIGFSAFYLNRCNRSGILSGGVIGGNEQNGNYKIDARFPRNELIKKIEVIGHFKRQVSISNMDAELYLLQYVNKLGDNTLTYLDPPYYKKSKDLYLNSYKHKDHLKLSKTIQTKLKARWMLSYDLDEHIIDFYKGRRCFTYNLQYSVYNSHKGTELFIFDDDLLLPERSEMKSVDLGLKTLI